MEYGERISILDCNYSVLKKNEIYSIVDTLISDGGSHQISISNVHTTMLAVEDKTFQKIINSAAIVTMDGLPIVWAAKLKGQSQATRVSGPDFFEHICAISPQKNYSHFLYGGQPGIPERMKDILEKRYPGIRIAGTYSPPFRSLTPKEDAEVIKMINQTRPNFLWVGLGAPKQERWIYEHLPTIHANIQIGIGAAFDFVAGSVKRAPKWMQNSGIEWLYRFRQDPIRLWKRYFIYNTKFIIKIIPDIIRHNAP